MTTNSKNHVVNITGRGAQYCMMMTGDTQDIANACQVCLNSGFEVFIYLLEPSQMGQLGFMPKGALNLRRVYHLYDAHEQYEERAKDIVETLSCHSMQASVEYIDTMLRVLNTERSNLIADVSPFPSEPSASTTLESNPNTSTTGS